MISPELLRRYSFFAGLSMEQITALAQIAEKKSVDAGHYFFREGDPLTTSYLVLEGAVGIVFAVPDRDIEQEISGQLTGALKTQDVTVSTVGTGNVFGWSALIPPYNALDGAMAITPCQVIAFRSRDLLRIFEKECNFGYLMIQKSAQVIRERLRDLRIESLAALST